MIDVTAVGDLTFEIRFDEKLREDLKEVAGWGTSADAIQRILSDIILGCNPYREFDCDFPSHFLKSFPRSWH
ncbi:hypothetical protein C1T17_07915 [Sphingobium sp. SCG-1]|uniref:hypothetical protein n=1 Tax=Sphingobium sp. SCG-1 TaxID=2072936 RepID=UPI000CD6AA00|nr:hypothetical protein [Sphingobium sp. SCG-1]AUW58043.1 hypothetical protein C1T17_07915 [Sphingobium sp. SCG-1]